MEALSISDVGGGNDELLALVDSDAPGRGMTTFGRRAKMLDAALIRLKEGGVTIFDGRRKAVNNVGWGGFRGCRLEDDESRRIEYREGLERCYSI